MDIEEVEEAEHMLHQNIQQGIQQGMHQLMEAMGAAAEGALLGGEGGGDTPPPSHTKFPRPCVNAPPTHRAQHRHR